VRRDFCFTLRVSYGFPVKPELVLLRKHAPETAETQQYPRAPRQQSIMRMSTVCINMFGWTRDIIAYIITLVTLPPEKIPLNQSHVSPSLYQQTRVSLCCLRPRPLTRCARTSSRIGQRLQSVWQRSLSWRMNYRHSNRGQDLPPKKWKRKKGNCAIVLYFVSSTNSCHRGLCGAHVTNRSGDQTIPFQSVPQPLVSGLQVEDLKQEVEELTKTLKKHVATSAFFHRVSNQFQHPTIPADPPLQIHPSVVALHCRIILDDARAILIDH
jgi:hypothetical protein